MAHDPLLIRNLSGGNRFYLGNDLLRKSRASLGFPVMKSLLRILVHFFCQNFQFSQRHYFYGLFVSCIKYHIEAFPGDIGHFCKKSRLVRMFQFFIKLVYIYTVCSLDIRRNRLFILIENADGHRLCSDRPAS